MEEWEYNHWLGYLLLEIEQHEEQMNKILPVGQWYAGWAVPCDNKLISDYPIFFNIDDNPYMQSLKKYGEYKPCQL